MLNLEELRKIYKQYLRDPIQHTYLISDLLQHEEYAKVKIYSTQQLKYILTYIYQLNNIGSIYIHNEDVNIRDIEEGLEFCINKGCRLIYIFTPYIGELSKIYSLIDKHGLEIYRRSTWITMYMTYSTFRPKINPEYTVLRLNSNDDKHVYMFLEHMKSDRKINMNFEECKKFIEENPTYAIIVDDKIVSAAYVYLRNGKVAAIGGLFTKPEYRGLGYASTLLSYICKHLLEVGLIPFLHVDGENFPALKLYRKLGFKIHDTQLLLLLRCKS